MSNIIKFYEASLAGDGKTTCTKVECHIKDTAEIMLDCLRENGVDS